MTDDELQSEAERLHDLFHLMPNNDERKRLFIEWAKVRAAQANRIYRSGGCDNKRAYSGIK